MTRRIILIDIGAGLTLRGVLPSIALFADYTASLVASGGQAPYSYSLAAGALPAGLALDAATGIISGTAGVAGQSVFTVRVTDLSGAHVDRQFAITVIAEPLSLSGAAPAWTVGTPYSYTYSAAHGVPPYSWSLAAGALPAGLALNAATGEISGTPTAGNAPAWTVRVTDSAGASIDLRDNATLQLLGDFADATVGTAYSSDLLINGGDAPYSNPRVTVGALPAGLALSVVGDKLRLSGTPTAAATSNFTAAVDSADGQTAASVQSTVVAANGDPYWGTVNTLLHFDGSNGSATYTDETGQAWLPVGTAPVLTTANYKFGPSSLSFVGTGWIRTNAISATAWLFGTNSLTMEAWIKPTLVSDGGIISRRTGGTNGWALEARANGAVWFRANIGSVFSNTAVASAAGVLTAGVWQHIALCRNGTAWRIYVNGVQVAAATISGGLTDDSAANSAIGASTVGGGENPFKGQIDEVRVNNGHCYYIGPFTPPTQPFPNHA